MRIQGAQTRVMIAGVGGASLGTEIFKSLVLAGGVEIYGCDVSPTAYGLYQPGFAKTYRITRDRYVDQVLDCCRDAGVEFLIPGGEQPMALLGAAAERLEAAGVRLLMNAPGVVAACSDKNETFRLLASLQVPMPRTAGIGLDFDAQTVGLPCIVKPATDSGGSAGVFFALTTEEVAVYADYIRRMGGTPVAQEYVDEGEGEFTIGVLSLPDGTIVGSIALRRVFDAKLSVSYRGRGGLISSGYSQGYIDHFPGLCRQAERIAAGIGSRGPINVQGRVRGGVLLPFEINPRFSASTHLRSLAGFNEIEMLIRYHLTGRRPEAPTIRPGWYLRSLAEDFIPVEKILP
ncbi:MAG: ATP-grasp domain-containing protein [Proteobacteria bacterium]|nr:ATP-grasp domain-containing protein [Pseudomonadota bacterium]